MTAQTVHLEAGLVALVSDYVSSGGTYEQFAPIAAAIQSPDRVAALQALLAQETDPAMQAGLRAGIAEAQRQEASR